MTKTIRITACIMAATLVSGCQGFSNIFAFNKSDNSASEHGLQQAFGSEELERGRQALKAGYPARAIEQFRLAALNEEVAADAFNGMAVAYTRIGREDLAERYFKVAVTLEPTNEKFAANLARFYGSPLGQSKRALAMREQEALDTLARAEKAAELEGLLDIAPVVDEEDASPQETQVAITTLTLERPTANVTRTPREIRIATQGVQSPVETNFATVTVRKPIEIVAQPVAARASSERATVAVRKPIRIATTPAAQQAEEQGASEARAVAATLLASEQPAKRKPRRTVISLLGFASNDAVRPARIRISKPGSQGATRPRVRSYPVRLSLKTQAE